jgi:hypothetical protein
MSPGMLWRTPSGFVILSKTNCLFANFAFRIAQNTLFHPNFMACSLPGIFPWTCEGWCQDTTDRSGYHQDLQNRIACGQLLFADSMARRQASHKAGLLFSTAICADGSCSLRGWCWNWTSCRKDCLTPFAASTLRFWANSDRKPIGMWHECLVAVRLSINRLSYFSHWTE